MTTQLTTAEPQAAANTAVEPAAPRRIWRPLADILETKDGLTLLLELPGVAASDVEVSLEKRQLHIRARSNAASADRLRLVHQEYEAGDYERSFLLSEDFDSEKIEAEMKHGVLTLRLPRAEAARPRTIAVRAA